MVWRPKRTLGAVAGMAMLLIILGTAIFLTISTMNQEPGMSAFATLLLAIAAYVLLGLWIIWYANLWRITYTLTQNALIIDTGTRRHVIPLDTIKSVVTGDNVRQKEGFRGIGWPGYLSGSIELESLGQLVVCSTQPLAHQLIVVTNGGSYGISPAQAHYFVADLQFKQELGVTEHTIEEHIRTGIAGQSVWRDKTFLTLTAGAVLGNLALYALLSYHYAALPTRLFLVPAEASAEATIMAKRALYLLPGLGSLVLVANAVSGVVLNKSRQFASHLLGAAALVIQAPFFAALLTLVSQA